MEPVWEAVRFEAAVKAGRTKPLRLECQRGSGTAIARERFVTKALGLPEVHDFTLCHEFVGARVARLVDLAVPEVALVNLSPEFLDAARTDLESAGVRPSSGLGVGSMFIPNLLPFPSRASLGDAEVTDAARIYVLDALLQNADRRPGSPNCGRADQRIVPFDFENAFGFRFALSPPVPWRVSQLRFMTEHLFFRELARRKLDWPTILEPFRLLRPAAVTALCSTIPSAWRSIGVEIQAHIEAVLTHWPKFSQEVADTFGDRP